MTSRHISLQSDPRPLDQSDSFQHGRNATAKIYKKEVEKNDKTRLKTFNFPPAGPTGFIAVKHPLANSMKKYIQYYVYGPHAYTLLRVCFQLQKVINTFYCFGSGQIQPKVNCQQSILHSDQCTSVFNSQHILNLWPPLSLYRVLKQLKNILLKITCNAI